MKTINIDTNRTTKSKCTPSNKPCGSICIPQKNICHINTENKNFTKLKHSSALLPVVLSPKNETNRHFEGAVLSVGGLVATTGLSYAALKVKYNDGINKGADKAEQLATSLSKNKNEQQINPKKPTVFTVSGLRSDKEPDDYLSEDLGDVLSDYNVVSPLLTYNTVKIEEGSEDRKEEMIAKGVRITTTAASKYISPLMSSEGYNPDAVKLAAQVMTHKLKYPYNEVSLVGHSAGSVITNHAQEMLKKKGINLKVVNISGYYTGLENLSKEDNVTVLGKDDEVVKSFYSHNTHMVEGNHFPIQGRNSEGGKLLRKFLATFNGRKTEDSSEPFDRLRAKPPTIGFHQTNKLLLQIVNSIYLDKADAILGIPQLDNSENIVFRFRDGIEIYDGKITFDNRLTYVEAPVRGDAYLEGLYFNGIIPSLMPRAYVQGMLSSVIRSDAKHRRCQRGKPCGDTCIAKGDTCSRSLNLQTTQSANKLRKALNNKKTLALTGLGLGAGVLTVGAIALMANNTPSSQGSNKPSMPPPRPSTPSPATPKNKTPDSEQIKKKLEDLENEVVSQEDIKAAEEEIETEETAYEAALKANLAATQAESEQYISEQLKKQGIQPDVSSELDEIYKEQEKQRLAQTSELEGKTVTGRAKQKANIQLTKSGDIDIAKTLDTLGIGKPDTPVVDMNTVGQSWRQHTAQSLSEEYQKGIDTIASEAFVAMERSRVGLNANKRASARDNIRIQTAKRIQEFNKSFSQIAKVSLENSGKTFQDFAIEANDSQRRGRSMAADKVKFYQQATDLRPMVQSIVDATVRVQNQINLKPTKGNTGGMTSEQAKLIIEQTNNLIQQRSRSRFKRTLNLDSWLSISRNLYYLQIC